VEIDDALGRIVFEREGVRVRVNLGEQDWNVPVPDGFRMALASPGVAPTEIGLCVPPASVAVLEQVPGG
jgi:hypothetical protein